ncbi:DivIVA domain-containing protein [Naasia sp.]|uniref:DivIVA domain-containing protein n=1 Tax=Naasia sp. TaxID=2546198 RepID=UPI0026351C77|nr:DivIVA domain-containing protein [Naasia sp.]
MATTFPRSRPSKLGYRMEDVDAFLQAARRAYELPIGGTATVDAKTIRRTAFPMEKGGYSTVHVDAALERLEDAFALREREHAVKTMGDKAWFGEARSAAQEILDRLARPAGDKFDRAGFLTQGYAPRDVDEFCARLERYFKDGLPISVDDVRTIAFRPARRGYLEWQVDLLLDAVVDVMLAVR